MTPNRLRAIIIAISASVSATRTVHAECQAPNWSPFDPYCGVLIEVLHNENTAGFFEVAMYSNCAKMWQYPSCRTLEESSRAVDPASGTIALFFKAESPMLIGPDEKGKFHESSGLVSVIYTPDCTGPYFLQIYKLTMSYFHCGGGDAPDIVESEFGNKNGGWGGDPKNDYYPSIVVLADGTPKGMLDFPGPYIEPTKLKGKELKKKVFDFDFLTFVYCDRVLVDVVRWGVVIQIFYTCEEPNAFLSGFVTRKPATCGPATPGELTLLGGVDNRFDPVTGDPK